MDSSRNAPVADWRDCDVAYATRPGKTYVQPFRDAYGDDYPEEAEPHSFLTRTDLARIVRCLAIGPGKVLVDLGSGRGGPALWLARETGADLVGIDLSPNGVGLAGQRAAEMGLSGRARFVVGDLCATGLPDQSCDGAVSIDVLMYVPDKAAAVKEAARLLRPGARFALTAFEEENPKLYSLLLQDNGFEVEVDEEKPDWRSRQRVLYQRIVAEQEALTEEMGEGARVLIEEAEHFLATFRADGWAGTRHAFLVGRRT